MWGARTLSGQAEWRYVNVRRLLITIRRWLEHDMPIWSSIPTTRSSGTASRAARAYCYALFRAGALKGETPEEAYYVKCDAETNPPDVRDLGQVISRYWPRPSEPAEFIVVRITRGGEGTFTEALIGHDA